jgi:hypothetical protein
MERASSKSISSSRSNGRPETSFSAGTNSRELRFHWLKDLQTKQIEVLRFTRTLFGLAPSPFLLAGVIKEHLRSLKSKYPDLVAEIEQSLYVDDLIGGADCTTKGLELKKTAK